MRFCCWPSFNIEILLDYWDFAWKGKRQYSSTNLCTTKVLTTFYLVRRAPHLVYYDIKKNCRCIDLFHLVLQWMHNFPEINKVCLFFWCRDFVSSYYISTNSFLDIYHLHWCTYVRTYRSCKTRRVKLVETLQDHKRDCSRTFISSWRFSTQNYTLWSES
jgi:hypothetical protein